MSSAQYSQETDAYPRSKHHPHAKAATKIALTIAIIFFILFAIFSFSSIGKNSYGATSDSMMRTSSTTTSKNRMKYLKRAIKTTTEKYFVLQRSGYEDNELTYFDKSTSTQMTYKFLSAYESIIEPLADMKLVQYSNGSQTAMKDHMFMVCPGIYDNSDYMNSKAKNCQTGFVNETYATAINFHCQPHDNYTVVVTSQSSSDSYIFSAVCMYVRREIRSMTKTDRDRFLDVSHMLWEVDEDKGQTLYGSAYHSAKYLLYFHHFNAALQDADHIHDGLGFLIQHIKFTNLFEGALQAIDPSVSLPYWDFTIDVSSGHTVPYQTYVFSEDIYGSIALPKNYSRGYTHEHDDIVNAAIPNGRWAKLSTGKQL